MVRLLDEPTGGPTGFAASPASSIGGAGPPSPVGTPQSRPGSGQRPYRSAGLARLPPEDPGIAMLGFGMPTQAAARPVSASSIGSGGESGRKASLARLPDDVLQLQLQGQPQLLPQASSPLLPIGRGSGDAGRSAVVGLGGPTSASSSSAAPGIETAKKSGLSAMRDRLGKGLSVSTGTAEPQIKSQVFRLLTNGETITNYYEFAEEIYSGGAKGKVLVAKRKSNGEEVIVKIRTKQTNRGGERGWRAIMSQVCSMKGSIHVLDITEILEDELAFYVVMPKCNGGELFEFLVTETEVPEAECKRIIREILIAVGHLHSRGLVHRDVKPENIMFDIVDKTCSKTPKTVKLIDFDTCVEWTPASPKSSRFVGTPGYIAPEALLGQITPQSDLWSIGVILYILMTGETPWSSMVSLEDGTVGSPGAKKMYQALKQEVVEWDKEPWPDFPLARDLCQKLLAFNMEERADTVREALEHAWLSDAPGAFSGPHSEVMSEADVSDAPDLAIDPSSA